jgi:hypothetical protein
MRGIWKMLGGLVLCMVTTVPVLAGQRDDVWCYKNNRIVPAQAGEACDRVRWLLLKKDFSETVKCIGAEKNPGELWRQEVSQHTLLYTCTIGATVSRTAFTCANAQKKIHSDGPFPQVDDGGRVVVGSVDDVWCDD